jgi:polyketide-type polyunsaturated fatty acid synthase PfaA
MKTISKTTKPTLNQELHTTPLAVIGMSSIFPQAHNLQEYWDNILNKVDTIVDIPASRWKIDEYYDPNPAAPDKTYCKRGAFIPDIQFDPAEFGLPPNILEATDVTQLLSLVVAKECLEDAGYGGGREFSRENTGVILGFVGIGSKLVIPLMARLQYPVWEKVLRSYGIPEEDVQKIIAKIKLAYPNWEENTFPGSIGNVVSGRIANRFDLGGTNCVVDAACASSLAAIHMAASELIEGRADMMITGGVDLDNSIGAFMCFSKTPAFSKNQNPSPFDKDSDGMMVGEGIGMVMLKRLADARRDGDRIYAIIKGIGTSSDGRFKSIYAPRPAGQSLAMRRAYTEAGYSPATVGLIEAHGTGTMAGDPAEFQGLNDVFSENNPDKQTIALGSVKSQIAHTKAAAGVASLIKVSLALYHKVLPATIHVNTPNPKLEIEKSPFYLNTEIRPWLKPARHARRGGVSSFGFGGTNFHVALEENESEQTGAYRLNATSKVVLLSAPTPEGLLTGCQGWSEKLKGPQSKQEFVNLVSAWTAKALQHIEARVGFVAANEGEAVSQLAIAVELIKANAAQESAEHPAGVYYRRSGLDPQGKLVALFPGQGSQYVDMGRELAVNFPPVRQAFADMDAAFEADGLRPLSSVVYPVPAFDNGQKESQSNTLTQTEFAQPAIGTLNAGLYKLLQQAGFKADFTAGHSFGELTALWVAGVYNEDAYFTLAKARGKAMAPTTDPNFDTGTMLAVKGDVAALQEELKAFPEITLANWNSNNQVVLAGNKPAISTIQKVLVEKGYSVIALPVSAAFHTALVGHAQKPFAETIKKVKFAIPGIPVYSNTTGQVHSSDPEQIRQSLAEHILKPVRFKDEIEAIYAHGGRIYVEFGPKNVLTNLVNNILEGKPHSAVALNPNAKKDSDRQFREAIAQLCVLGLDLRTYDAYALAPQSFIEAKKSAISVMLNGGLYLTDKTRSAFEKAVAQKDSLSAGAAIQESKARVSASGPHPVSHAAGMPIQAVFQSGTDQVADRLQVWQDETLKSHNRFLSNDSEYMRLFGQITKQELDLLSGNSSPQMLEQINTALQTLERSLVQFHQHQAETQYLRSQAELINSLMQVQNIPGFIPAALPVSKPTEVQPGASTLPEPVGTQSSGNGHVPVESVIVLEPVILADTAPAISHEILTQSLLEIVSEKTGYPTEMLELGMDMEADLGIDSIKRVEILGAMQARYPELPRADTSVLSELRSLGQIIDYMVVSAPAAQAPAPVLDLVKKSAAVVKIASPDPVGVKIETVKQALLEIVSEKTGYPIEMLDPSMDMEADLGIDSIKRVEILGALQTRFPELPKADAAALAELHSLNQITEYLTSVAQAGQPHLPQTQLTAQVSHEPSTESRQDEPASPIQSLARGVVALKFLPSPDHLDMIFPKDHTCILMDGGTDLTPALAQALSGQGIKVVVLGLTNTLVGDQKPMPKSIQRVLMEDLTETGIQNTLASLQQEYGPAGMYIHLDPPGTADEAFSGNEETIARTAFLVAKYLMKNLTESAQVNYAAFVTVTHMDGEFGLTTSGFFEPVSGSLFGLVKTLNLEWDKVFCRAIDLSPDVNLTMAVEHIMAELYDPNRLISEVGYSSKGRFTLVVEQPESEN